MATPPASDSLTKLFLTDSFYSWFVKTNELVDKVNPIQLYGITASYTQYYEGITLENLGAGIYKIGYNLPHTIGPAGHTHEFMGWVNFAGGISGTVVNTINGLTGDRFVVTHISGRGPSGGTAADITATGVDGAIPGIVFSVNGFTATAGGTLTIPGLITSTLSGNYAGYILSVNDGGTFDMIPFIEDFDGGSDASSTGNPGTINQKGLRVKLGGGGSSAGSILISGEAGADLSQSITNHNYFTSDTGTVINIPWGEQNYTRTGIVSPSEYEYAPAIYMPAYGASISAWEDLTIRTNWHKAHPTEGTAMVLDSDNAEKISIIPDPRVAYSGYWPNSYHTGYTAEHGSAIARFARSHVKINDTDYYNNPYAAAAGPDSIYADYNTDGNNSSNDLENTLTVVHGRQSREDCEIQNDWQAALGIYDVHGTNNRAAGSIRFYAKDNTPGTHLVQMGVVSERGLYFSHGKSAGTPASSKFDKMLVVGGFSGGGDLLVGYAAGANLNWYGLGNAAMPTDATDYNEGVAAAIIGAKNPGGYGFGGLPAGTIATIAGFHNIHGQNDNWTGNSSIYQNYFKLKTNFLGNDIDVKGATLNFYGSEAENTQEAISFLSSDRTAGDNTAGVTLQMNPNSNLVLSGEVEAQAPIGLEIIKPPNAGYILSSTITNNKSVLKWEKKLNVFSRPITTNSGNFIYNIDFLPALSYLAYFWGGAHHGVEPDAADYNGYYLGYRTASATDQFARFVLAMRTRQYHSMNLWARQPPYQYYVFSGRNGAGITGGGVTQSLVLFYAQMQYNRMTDPNWPYRNAATSDGSVPVGDAGKATRLYRNWNNALPDSWGMQSPAAAGGCTISPTLAMARACGGYNTYGLPRSKDPTRAWPMTSPNNQTLWWGGYNGDAASTSNPDGDWGGSWTHTIAGQSFTGYRCCATEWKCGFYYEGRGYISELTDGNLPATLSDSHPGYKAHAKDFVGLHKTDYMRRNSGRETPKYGSFAAVVANQLSGHATHMFTAPYTVDYCSKSTSWGSINRDMTVKQGYYDPLYPSFVDRTDQQRSSEDKMPASLVVNSNAAAGLIVDRTKLDNLHSHTCFNSQGNIFWDGKCLAVELSTPETYGSHQSMSRYAEPQVYKAYYAADSNPLVYASYPQMAFENPADVVGLKSYTESNPLYNLPPADGGAYQANIRFGYNIPAGMKIKCMVSPKMEDYAMKFKPDTWCYGSARRLYETFGGSAGHVMGRSATWATIVRHLEHCFNGGTYAAGGNNEIPCSLYEAGASMSSELNDGSLRDEHVQARYEWNNKDQRQFDIRETGYNENWLKYDGVPKPMHTTGIYWKGSDSVPVGDFTTIWIRNSSGEVYEFNPHVFADRSARGYFGDNGNFVSPMDSTRYIRGNLWTPDASRHGLLITSWNSAHNGYFNLANNAENRAEYPSGSNDGVTFDNYESILNTDPRYPALQNRTAITGLRSDFTYPLTVQWDGSRKALNSWNGTGFSRCSSWAVSLSGTYKSAGSSYYADAAATTASWNPLSAPADPNDMGLNDSIYTALDSRLLISNLGFVYAAVQAHGIMQYGGEPLHTSETCYYGMPTIATMQVSGSNHLGDDAIPETQYNERSINSSDTDNQRWKRFQSNELWFHIKYGGWLPDTTRSTDQFASGKFFGFALAHRHITSTRDSSGVMFEIGSDFNRDKPSPLPFGEGLIESGTVDIACTLKHNGNAVLAPILIWDVEINNDYLYDSNDPHSDVIWWEGIHRVNTATLTDYPDVDYGSNVTTTYGGGQLDGNGVYENEDQGLGANITSPPATQSIANDLFTRTDILNTPIKYYALKYYDASGRVRWQQTPVRFRLQMNEITLKR